MANSQVLQFMQKTAEDESLRLQLEQLMGVGDGDISSAEELDSEELAVLKGVMAPKVVEFAQSHSFDFSADELITVVESFAKYQAGTISDAEFSKILGISVSRDGAQHTTKVANPLKRLSRYLSKTYLGIDKTPEED